MTNYAYNNIAFFNFFMVSRNSMFEVAMAICNLYLNLWAKHAGVGGGVCEQSEQEEIREAVNIFGKKLTY